MCTTIVVCQLGKKVFHALVHAVDEFFDTGRYLIFGSLVAASDADLPTYPYPYDHRAQFGDSHPHHDAPWPSSSRFVQRPMPLSGLRLLSSFWSGTNGGLPHHRSYG